MGDIRVEGERIYGDGVNIAARLEGLAEAGGICVSGEVHGQVEKKLSLGFEDLGEQDVKNIARPVRVFRVELGAPAPAPAGGAASEPADEPSIVVLPFANMSGDAEQEYFVDGMTEDLITSLARISGLSVIARNSAFVYKGRAVDVKQVSAELGARYVVEGSVRRSHDRVRITAQLLDGTTGRHLWAERYDRGLEDIFALQDEVTTRIVHALGLKLLPAGRRNLMERSRTENLEAYDQLLRGLAFLARAELDSARQARAMFERAIELDPDFAGAHAALALTYALGWFNQWDRDSAPLERAAELCQRALTLDPSLSEPYGVLAWYRLAHGGEIASLDFGGAADQFNDAKDAAFRFSDTLFGSRSILRDFQQQLADGEDNVLDYANALQTVADRGDLLRLFDELTEAAKNSGVGLDAQARALQTVIRDGRLTGQQVRFLTDQFVALATTLDRGDLIGEGTEFQLSTLAAAAAGLREEFDLLVAASLPDLADFELDLEIDPSIAATIERTAAAMDVAAEDAAALAEEVDGLPDLIKAVGSASNATDEELLGLAEQYGAATAAADLFRSRTLELTDPVFAAAAAQERLVDAEEDLAEVLADSEASAADRANAELDRGKAVAEADAALRGLGDISLDEGRFAKSVEVLGLLLGKTREEVLLLLEDAGILDNTEIEPTVVFNVDDRELETSLAGIPDEVEIGVRYEVDSPFRRSGGAGAPPNVDFDLGAGGGGVQQTPGVVVQVNNPTDSDIAGGVAQGANIAAGIIGATGAFSGRQP